MSDGYLASERQVGSREVKARALEALRNASADLTAGSGSERDLW